jgi:hypothetical protein
MQLRHLGYLPLACEASLPDLCNRTVCMFVRAQLPTIVNLQSTSSSSMSGANHPPCQPTPATGTPPPFPHPTVLQGSEKVWRGVFMGRFGLPSKNQETAHKLAGSWQVSRQMLPPHPLTHARLAQCVTQSVASATMHQLSLSCDSTVSTCTPEKTRAVATRCGLSHSTSPTQRAAPCVEQQHTVHCNMLCIRHLLQ